jgi:hypothetical protein
VLDGAAQWVIRGSGEVANGAAMISQSSEPPISAAPSRFSTLLFMRYKIRRMPDRAQGSGDHCLFIISYIKQSAAMYN